MYLRFFKSELFRASKHKCVYILILVLAAVLFLESIVFLKFSIPGMSQDDVYSMGQEGYSAEGMSESFNMGFNAGRSTSLVVHDEEEDMSEEDIPAYTLSDFWGEGLFYNDDFPTLYWLNVSSSFHLFAVAVFTALFLGSTYKYGYDKNLIVGNRYRFSLFFARITVIAIYSAILLIATFLITVVYDLLFTGSVDWNLDSSVLGYSLVSFVLSFAFSMIAVFIATLTKNTAASMTVSIMLSMGFLSLGLSIISFVMTYIFPSLPSDFQLVNYTITQNAEALSLQSTGKEVLRALIVAVVYSFLSIEGSLLIIRRRDIG